MDSMDNRAKRSIGGLLVITLLLVIWTTKSRITANVVSNTLTRMNATTEKIPELDEVPKLDKIIEGNLKENRQGKLSFGDGDNECEKFSCQSVVMMGKKFQPNVTEILEGESDNDILAIQYAKNLYKLCRLGEHQNTTFSCTLFVWDRFKIAIMHKLVLQQFKNSQEFIGVRNQVTEMSSDIKKEYDRVITGMFLRQGRKSNVLFPNIPEFLFDRTKVQKEYTNLSLHQNQSFLEQVTEIDAWANSNQVDKELERHWTLFPEQAYVERKNFSIIVSLAMLQPPYFHPNWTRALNYGGLGSIIANEFAHAYLSRDWQLYNESPANCLKNQYSSLVPGYFRNAKIALYADSKLTNTFASNLGLYFAMEAYSKRMHSHHCISDSACMNEYKMFFQGFKQASCGSYFKIGKQLKEEQGADMLDVNIALRNSIFPQLYECSEGSFMYPYNQKACHFELKKRSVKKDLSQQYPSDK